MMHRGQEQKKTTRTRGAGQAKGAWVEEFLEAYERLGDGAQARKIAGVGRTQFYLLRDKDPEFAAQVREIFETWIDRIADGSKRRALVGTVKRKRVPVRRTSSRSSAGDVVEIEYETVEDREHSFARERFWLERMRPDEFGEKDREDLSAAEYAQRIHAALAAMDGSMDEDEPGGEG